MKPAEGCALQFHCTRVISTHRAEKQQTDQRAEHFGTADRVQGLTGQLSCKMTQAISKSMNPLQGEATTKLGPANQPAKSWKGNSLSYEGRRMRRDDETLARSSSSN
jgi:hypothetical protein